LVSTFDLFSARFAILKAMNRKGFAPIPILIAVVAVLAVAGGIWYYESHRFQTSTTISPTGISPTESSNWSQMARNYLLSNGIIHGDTQLISDVNNSGGGDGSVDVFFPSFVQPPSGITYDNWQLLINNQNEITVNRSSTALVKEGIPECVYYHVQTEAEAVTAIRAVYPLGPAQAWPEATDDSYTIDYTINASNSKHTAGPCYWSAEDGQYIYQVNDKGVVTRFLLSMPQP
jgi:hypothetical protein